MDPEHLHRPHRPHSASSEHASSSHRLHPSPSRASLSSSSRMSSRSTSVLPPESCLNWHLTPKDAARLFCKRLDSVQPPPTPSDLVVDRSEQGDTSTVDRRRSGSGYHRRKDDYSFDQGVERAEQLLTLGDFVARRLLEANLTLGPSVEERSITNACRLAFKINALKWLQCQAYSDALRQAAAGQSAIISKPRFCSNRQAAERTLNGYRGAQDPKRPLLALVDPDRPAAGSALAVSIVMEAEARAPALRPNDDPLSPTRLLTLASIGWEYLDCFRRLQALGVVDELETEFGSPISGEVAAEVETIIDEIRRAAAEEFRRGLHEPEARRRNRREADQRRRQGPIVFDYSPGAGSSSHAASQLT